MTIKEQKMYFGIYCIECKVTKIKYIGKTRENFYRRWIFHKWNLKNNHHSNTYLQNAWNKYGKENFEFYPITKFLVSNEVSDTELNKLEIKYILEYMLLNRSI